MAKQGQASSMDEEKELVALRDQYKTISKNIVYTYVDFSNDIFAKRLFD